MQLPTAAGSVPAMLIATTLFLTPPSAVSAQEAAVSTTATVERCSTPEHSEFDFWLGEWAVRNAEGALVGHNEITRVARGCGLLESWRGVGGSRGVSINTYDSLREKWTQRWVGDGASLWLEGGLQEGRMVLAGPSPRTTPAGEVLDRLTWTPLPDGRVRQSWEVSTDEGQVWKPLFDGYYERVGDAGDGWAAAGEVTAREAVAEEPRVVRLSDALDWQLAPSGAAFAPIHGRAAEAGPFAFWMRMPANWEMAPHSHNTVEHVTVLSGTLFMKFSPSGAVIELPAGSVAVVPAGRAMWAWTRDETVIQVHGVGPFMTQPVEAGPPSESGTTH